MASESSGSRRGSKSSFLSALMPSQSRKTLRKKGPPRAERTSVDSPVVAPLAPLQAHREKYRDLSAGIDTQLGEHRDHTELLHALGKYDPFDAEDSPPPEEEDLRPPGDLMVGSLSPELWTMIMDYLRPIDAAFLAVSSRTLYHRLGYKPWELLNRPENYRDKIDFLLTLDRHLPCHLLCFPCAAYHLRTQLGKERLTPADVLNPLFNCPNSRNPFRAPSRMRIAPRRNLPFAFVQLAMRAHRFSPKHGIELASLHRRWKSEEWSYSTRFHIHKGHVLMRVIAQAYVPSLLTPSGVRLLLYSRDDYTPYFSVCAHWKQGELMKVCKCALSHIPQAREIDGLMGLKHKFKDQMTGQEYNPNALISLCGECQPMRRCPDCPTEYLVEFKLTEDRTLAKNTLFRRAIVVTRWSDLGEGSTPMDPEWMACNGELKGYDSFAAIGKRAISGIFESAFTQDTIPGQRILSLAARGANQNLGKLIVTSPR